MRGDGRVSERQKIIQETYEIKHIVSEKIGTESERGIQKKT